MAPSRVLSVYYDKICLKFCNTSLLVVCSLHMPKIIEFICILYICIISMHSNVTIKNVSWPHFSWPTL